MKKLSKPISIAISPNVQADDVFLALSLILWPWSYNSPKPAKDAPEGHLKALEGHFERVFQGFKAAGFVSGRTALWAILKAKNLPEGSEVVVPGFTCGVVVNSILSLKLKPVFCDVDNSLNLDPVQLSKLISPQTKAVLMQHTFGVPAQISEIKKICQEKNLFLIEDCAHALGQNDLGLLGDAAFFSFGRDKMASSVFGGMAICKDQKLAQEISNIQKNLPQPKLSWVAQQLLHPILTKIFVLPFYNSLGRKFMAGFLRLKMLSRSVEIVESQGQMPENMFCQMPEALAHLAWHQIKKLDTLNRHRQELCKIYREILQTNPRIQVVCSQSLPLMRFPVLVDDGNLTRAALQELNIFLNDGWHGSNIVPESVNLQKIGYRKNSCPKGEQIAKQIICLPTNISISQFEASQLVERVANLI